MNTIEAYSTTSPFGKIEECAKFAIDDTSTPFGLHNILTIGYQYTFGCWLKSESECSLVVAGTTFPASTAWQKYDVTFTASGKDLSLTFGVVGTYYIYHAQLERGSVATDWTPSPDDMDDSVESLIQRTETARTDAISNSTEIMLSALKEYVETSNFEQYKETVKTELSVMANEIVMGFTETEEQISNVDGDLQTKFKELYDYIQFSGGSVTFGSNSTPLTLKIGKATTDGEDVYKISFLKNGVEFGWWDGDYFYTGNIVVRVNERAQFGNFAAVPRSDGSLSWLLTNKT